MAAARESLLPACQRHGHCCLTCSDTYRCDGPEETGYCAPVCPACYWVELGSQIKAYAEVVTELAKKRTAIARRIGRDACREVVARRRKLRSNRPVVVAFGNVMARPEHSHEHGLTAQDALTQKDASQEKDFSAQKQSSAHRHSLCMGEANGGLHGDG